MAQQHVETDNVINGGTINAMSAEELYQESIKKLNAKCDFYRLNPDEAIADSEKYLTKPFVVSVCAIKNGRRKMEDRHVLLHDLNTLFGIKSNKQYSYYAVFDGHAGINAATYTASHLHLNLINSQAFKDGDIEAAIKKAFSETDLYYLERSAREKFKSGSTAVCCLFEGPSKLYLAWLGDSQAVLVKNGKPYDIMNPHKPERADERTRIEEMGGMVSCIDTWRVNGTLAVSRAIGDPEHKPYVSSDPDVEQINLDGSEDFLIMACDGLWDQITPEEATTIVYQHLAENSESDLNEVAEDTSFVLTENAKKEGSTDNITVIVLFLRDIKSILSTPFTPPSPKERSLVTNLLDFNENNSLSNPFANQEDVNFNSTEHEKNLLNNCTNHVEAQTPPVDTVLSDTNSNLHFDRFGFGSFDQEELKSESNPFADWGDKNNKNSNDVSEKCDIVTSNDAESEKESSFPSWGDANLNNPFGNSISEIRDVTNEITHEESTFSQFEDKISYNSNVFSESVAATTTNPVTDGFTNVLNSTVDNVFGENDAKPSDINLMSPVLFPTVKSNDTDVFSSDQQHSVNSDEQNDLNNCEAPSTTYVEKDQPADQEPTDNLFFGDKTNIQNVFVEQKSRNLFDDLCFGSESSADVTAVEGRGDNVFMNVSNEEKSIVEEATNETLYFTAVDHEVQSIIEKSHDVTDKSEPLSPKPDSFVPVTAFKEEVCETVDHIEQNKFEEKTNHLLNDFENVPETISTNNESLDSKQINEVSDSQFILSTTENKEDQLKTKSIVEETVCLTATEMNPPTVDDASIASDADTEKDLEWKFMKINEPTDVAVTVEPSIAVESVEVIPSVTETYSTNKKETVIESKLNSNSVNESGKALPPVVKTTSSTKGSTPSKSKSLSAAPKKPLPTTTKSSSVTTTVTNKVSTRPATTASRTTKPATTLSATTNKTKPAVTSKVTPHKTVTNKTTTASGSASPGPSKTGTKPLPLKMSHVAPTKINENKTTQISKAPTTATTMKVTTKSPLVAKNAISKVNNGRPATASAIGTKAPSKPNAPPSSGGGLKAKSSVTSTAPSKPSRPTAIANSTRSTVGSKLSAPATKASNTASNPSTAMKSTTATTKSTTGLAATKHRSSAPSIGVKADYSKVTSRLSTGRLSSKAKSSEKDVPTEAKVNNVEKEVDLNDEEKKENTVEKIVEEQL